MTVEQCYLGPHRVCLEKWIECAPFEKMLGIEIVEAQNGHSRLTLPFTAMLANGGCMMHGGALVSLADTAAVMAIKSLLPPGTHFGTVRLEVDFQRPVLQGIVTARCAVTKLEERLWRADVEIDDDQPQQVMRMNALFKISRRRPAAQADAC